MYHQFFVYKKRHDKWVGRISRKLGGETFHTAPFDIIDENKRFVEVKVNGTKARKHWYRIILSEDEVKFGRMVESYWVMLIVEPSNEVFFFPFKEIVEKVNRKNPVKAKLVTNRYMIWIGKNIRSKYTFNL